ncbi:MAG: FG-GAP repeat domain-containing protein [Salinibacter sp.]|uniref:FG-GAP repeat domain-containing protein n=1 Tax=Salinibacter sp. TaxID=2065818 RepID=UPI0035D3EC7D
MPRALHVAIACVLGTVLTGCAASSETKQDSPPSFPEAYQRVVAPSVLVLDKGGTPISNPFYGGFNTPRPQFVDIDGDGDTDLFVQERPGRLTFFERVARGDTSHLVWRTDHYRDLEIGEWYRFADLDQDGVPDLLTEQPYSYIRVYQNVGTSTSPEFTLFTDTLRTPSGEPIFSDRQNIPNVTDLGCNGKLDLFLGRLDGTITRYEAAEDSAGMPEFALVTEQFEGIKIVGGAGKKGPSLHGANTLTFADVDDDGDSDLFWGDFFEPGLLLIENTGSCSNPVLSSRPVRFPPDNPLKTSGYNAPALTDWTGNGRIDLFVGVLGGSSNSNSSLADNFYFYEHTAEGYQLRTRQFVGGIDVGSESTVALGDLDGDETTDALVANKIDPDQGKTSLVYPFHHARTSGPSKLRKRAPLDLPNAYRYAPALGDLTGDGSADLVVGTWQGTLSYYENQGDGTFTAADEVIGPSPDGSSIVPALGDLTGDGVLDLVVGTASGTVALYRNAGTASAPDFSQEADTLATIDSRAAPALHDADGDGTLDLLLGTKDELVLLQNQGTSKAPAFGAPTTIDLKGVPRRPTPALGDLNGDGKPELVMGGQRGGLVLFQSRRPEGKPVPVAQGRAD